MVTAADCARLIEPVGPGLPAWLVRQRFVDDPGLPGLPVQVDGKVAHLLDRRSFLARCAGRYGWSLAQGHSLEEWLALPGFGGPPASVQAGASVEQLAELFQDGPAGEQDRLVVVLAGTRYRGLATQNDCLTGLLRHAREQAAAVARARDEAQRQARAKDAFLANMSHELRTPLTAVIGFAEAAAEVPSSVDQAEMLRLVRSAGENLLGVVNDLLDLAKIGGGGLVLAPAPFAPLALASDALALVRGRAALKRLALRLVADQELPGQLVGDDQRLRQVLVNLLANAVKFTERGSVTLRLGWQGGMLSAAVEDTGVGIAESDLQRLFRPFSQVDESLTRRHQGAGLGLAICRQLAELMGGRLTVTSRLGRGSIFSLVVPLAVAGAAERSLQPA
ncbi:MAG: ATP-binding protein [Planctomycetes bacterium]|nr:ATP-binding protein [Planctomycetota bacterium]